MSFSGTLLLPGQRAATFPNPPRAGRPCLGAAWELRPVPVWAPLRRASPLCCQRPQGGRPGRRPPGPPRVCACACARSWGCRSSPPGPAQRIGSQSCQRASHLTCTRFCGKQGADTRRGRSWWRVASRRQGWHAQTPPSAALGAGGPGCTGGLLSGGHGPGWRASVLGHLWLGGEGDQRMS